MRCFTSRTRARRAAWAIALCAVALVPERIARAAEPRPIATFDRPLWSPDGTTLAFEAAMFRPEFSLDVPSRVDTLLYDPIAGRFSCATPRVAAFALNAARDSIMFADEYGAYIAPYPNVTQPRCFVWRGPSADHYVRQLDFAADGRYLVYSGCFSQLSPGCWDKWIVTPALDREPLVQVLAMQAELRAFPNATGLRPEYLRYQKRKTGPTLMDDLEPRAALLRAAATAAGVPLRAKGAKVRARIDVLYGREIKGDGRWLASVRLHPGKSSLARVFTCLYDPRTRSASVLAEDVVSTFLVVSPAEVLYTNTSGHLWRISLSAAAVERERVVGSFVPAWAQSLGAEGTVYAARARGLPTPERADQLVRSLVVQGHRAWPAPGANDTWVVNVGWFDSQAEADSATAMLSAQGYDAVSLPAKAHQVRNAAGARPGRLHRLRVPNGPLAGAEAIVDVTSGKEGPQTLLSLRKRGEEPRSVLNGYDDPLLP